MTEEYGLLSDVSDGETARRGDRAGEISELGVRGLRT
jgi:hypothetical protein